MAHHLQKGYMDQLEQEETFRDRWTKQKYTLMFHRPNRTLDRQETSRYNRRFACHNGELLLQSKHRVTPSPSQEKSLDLQTRRRHPSQGVSQTYELANLRKATTFGERQVLNKSNGAPRSQISQVFGPQREEYTRAMGIHPFTSLKNHHSLQETKKVTAHQYLRDNPAQNVKVKDYLQLLQS